MVPLKLLFSKPGFLYKLFILILAGITVIALETNWNRDSERPLGHAGARYNQESTTTPRPQKRSPAPGRTPTRTPPSAQPITSTTAVPHATTTEPTTPNTSTTTSQSTTTSKESTTTVPTTTATTMKITSPTTASTTGGASNKLTHTKPNPEPNPIPNPRQQRGRVGGRKKNTTKSKHGGSENKLAIKLSPESRRKMVGPVAEQPPRVPPRVPAAGRTSEPSQHFALIHYVTYSTYTELHASVYTYVILMTALVVTYLLDDPHPPMEMSVTFVGALLNGYVTVKMLMVLAFAPLSPVNKDVNVVVINLLIAMVLLMTLDCIRSTKKTNEMDRERRIKMAAGRAL